MPKPPEIIPEFDHPGYELCYRVITDMRRYLHGDKKHQRDFLQHCLAQEEAALKTCLAHQTNVPIEPQEAMEL